MKRNNYYTTRTRTYLPVDTMDGLGISGGGCGDSVVSGGDCVGGGAATARIEHRN